MYKEGYFESCGAGNIHVNIWEPDGGIRGVVQIVHGIAEYGKRYEDFARFLNQYGFLVIAEDHMGHGKSISNESPQGYFTGGWFSAVEDTYRLLKETMEEFPNVPYILFGHSMGSFMVRTILAKYPDSGITGAVICGTGWQPKIILKTGIFLSKQICKTKGEKKTSAFLQNLMFGAYNKRVDRPRTPYDWLNRIPNEIDAYVADPLCGFSATAGLARDLLLGIAYIQDKTHLPKMNKDLPVFFIAGGDDPVGSYGSGVRKTAEKFKDAGLEDVSVRIYPLCRHEILNEMNKRDIYLDVLNWIQHKI